MRRTARRPQDAFGGGHRAARQRRRLPEAVLRAGGDCHPAGGCCWPLGGLFDCSVLLPPHPPLPAPPLTSAGRPGCAGAQVGSIAEACEQFPKADVCINFARWGGHAGPTSRGAAGRGNADAHLQRRATRRHLVPCARSPFAYRSQCRSFRSAFESSMEALRQPTIRVVAVIAEVPSWGCGEMRCRTRRPPARPCLPCVPPADSCKAPHVRCGPLTICRACRSGTPRP